MKLMLVVAYDGAKFHGFQRQNNARNVQSELESALSKLYHQQILVKGAGRTDAKVHAKYQVVHFEVNQNIFNLRKKLNNLLTDIHVKKVQKVANDFHARHSVKSKTYLYKIALTNQKDNNYYLLLKNKLDIKKMQEASQLFLGTHDFRNFVAGERLNYTSTIFDIHIFKIGSVLYLKFKGLAFYRYMVRNLVGALIEIGKGKINQEVIQKMLDNKISKRLPTASPQGLYLIHIEY